MTIKNRRLSSGNSSRSRLCLLDMQLLSVGAGSIAPIRWLFRGIKALSNHLYGLAAIP
jgi:hypothetical protein